MKKILVFIVVAMLFAFPAIAKEYYTEFGMTINLPENFDVLEKDVPWGVKSVEENNKFLDESDSTLVAWDTLSSMIIAVSNVRENSELELDFRKCEEKEIEDFFDRIIYLNENGQTFDYQGGNGLFKKAYITDSTGLLGISEIVYITVLCGYEVTINVHIEDAVLTAEKEKRIDSIIQTVRFDDTLEKMQKEKIATIKSKIEAEEAETKRVRRVDFASFVVVLAVLLALIAVVAWVISGRRRKKGQ